MALAYQGTHRSRRHYTTLKRFQSQILVGLRNSVNLHVNLIQSKTANKLLNITEHSTENMPWSQVYSFMRKVATYLRSMKWHSIVDVFRSKVLQVQIRERNTTTIECHLDLKYQNLIKEVFTSRGVFTKPIIRATCSRTRCKPASAGCAFESHLYQVKWHTYILI